MTELKASTQRAQDMVSNYKRSLLRHGERDIRKAYERPSSKKVEAWDHCASLCKANHGKGLTVIGTTCHIFTGGFTFREKGKDWLCYITPSNDYKIALN